MSSRWQVRLRAGRRALERDLACSPVRQFFSPAVYSHYRVTLPLINEHVRGRLIDLGCGDMPFRGYVSGRVSGYDGLDLFPRSAAVTYVGDVQDMAMVADNVYDSALCLEVLEHVPDPSAAVREIYRILKPGGRLIVSVPHLSRLHDEPHDYYRFTRHGLRHLLQQAGFEVIALVKRGGLFSFLGHQVSTLALSLTWSVPVLKSATWMANTWGVTRPCYWLDSRSDRSGVFAMGYSAVASKAAEPSALSGGSGG
jgi:SAM-dependent methyltransferase